MPHKRTRLLDAIRTFFDPCRLSAPQIPDAATSAPPPSAQSRPAMRTASAPRTMAVFAVLTILAPVTSLASLRAQARTLPRCPRRASPAHVTEKHLHAPIGSMRRGR
eukprot:4900265-Pyramimonas_sp.AAC.1